MREYIEYFLFSCVDWLARRLSFRWAGKIGAWLGGVVFSVIGYRKEITLDNLRKAFPEKHEEDLQVIARRAYRNYGIALVESLWASGQSAEELRKIVRATNPEIVHNARKAGKGVLLLSAHFGSWEFLSTSVPLVLELPFGMIAQRQRNKHIDALFETNRSRFGNFIIGMGTSTRKVLKALADNHVVLILGDQSGPKEAVFVEFFGRPSATHRGAAAFSLKTGAPIVMGVLVRQPDGTYTITFEEVDQSGLDSSSEEDITKLTQRHVAILERWIRTNPDHWLWMHKRWKHTPFFQARQEVEEVR
ncbi:MAG: lysophospholipid acyltransferase family protein [Bacteroidetes bacterium]|nr:lysophospholipid acyltransferase family protein [Bacteroidota bacterium]MCW5897394.1 lysophospholipid acyltransferase family protein [Bacteroidota bacterium]